MYTCTRCRPAVLRFWLCFRRWSCSCTGNSLQFQSSRVRGCVNSEVGLGSHSLSRSSPITGGNCHKYHFCCNKVLLQQSFVMTNMCFSSFVMTNIILSRPNVVTTNIILSQQNLRRDKNMLVVTKHVFCHDKIMQISFLSQKSFVSNICHDKTCLLLQHAWTVVQCSLSLSFIYITDKIKEKQHTHTPTPACVGTSMMEMEEQEGKY